MEKQTNIPHLRFPEFNEKWDVKKLREISEVITKGTTPSKFVESGIRFIKIESFDRNNIDTKKCLLISSEIHNGELKRSILKEGDLLFAIAGATIGKCNIVPKEILPANTNQALSIIRLYPKENRTYIYFNLTSYRMDRYIRDNIAVGAQPNLNLQQMGDFPCPYPTLPEQQKIASFFTAIDQKISQLKRKKTLLEQYKKGVMQKIFSQEVRFKDDNGQEFPKWEKKRLGEIAEVKRGAASNHLKYVNDESKGIRLLRINDFLSDDAVYIEDTEDIKRFRVKTNDLLIAGTGATAGIIFIVPEKFNNMSFSYNAPRIRVKNAQHTFIYYYLKSDIIIREQKRLFVGNAQPFLDTDVMRGFKINLPSLPEQTKIANFLSAIDDKINHAQKQIEKAEVWKKGLMQQMFI